MPPPYLIARCLPIRLYRSHRARYRHEAFERAISGRYDSHRLAEIIDFEIASASALIDASYYRFCSHASLN